VQYEEQRDTPYHVVRLGRSCWGNMRKASIRFNWNFDVNAQSWRCVTAHSGYASQQCAEIDFHVWRSKPVFFFFFHSLDVSFIFIFTSMLIFLQRRSRDELLQLFPRLRCFKVHSWCGVKWIAYYHPFSSSWVSHIVGHFVCFNKVCWWQRLGLAYPYW